MSKEGRKKGIVALAAAGCLILIYICTITGITSIPVGEINRILVSKLLGAGAGAVDAGSEAIIWKVRMPRVILGFLAGGGLSVCGAAYQGIFRNPMADPYILGVSSGAALGASLGIIMHGSGGFAGLSLTALLAFAGAFATVFVVYHISRRGRTVPVASLLLSGIAVGQSLTALMSLVMIFNVQSMNQIMFWTLGSLNGKGWPQVMLAAPWLAAGAAVLLSMRRELDIMLMGVETATQLGVDTERLKKKVLISSSVITAVLVSVTGIIGFVGLVVPHVVRLAVGPKHRILLPFSLLFGGTFLVICDTLARSLSPSEIPVGIITAAFGGPFFLYLLRRSGKAGG